jgi:hypothetical protein
VRFVDVTDARKRSAAEFEKTIALRISNKTDGSARNGPDRTLNAPEFWGRTDEPRLCGAWTHAPDLSAKQHFLVSARTPLPLWLKGTIDYADNAEYFIWAKEASMSHPPGLSRARP